MFRDREVILKKCDYLYKTAITFKPIKVSLTINSNNNVDIALTVSDTILLLPPSYRSLSKATSLLDKKYHKKELSKDILSNMKQLLLTDKEKFDEYAIHDAEITLRLYIKLQYMLNKINGTTNKRYNTIGGVTTDYFMKCITIPTHKGSSPELKKNKTIFYSEQFSKSNTIYQQGLNLAKRAYMGGLNNSYIIGEVESELILDIDFSSAYPTVMNLLEYSDFGEKIEKINNNDEEKYFTMDGE